MTTVDQIRARVDAASTGPWQLRGSNLHRQTTLVDQPTYIGTVMAGLPDKVLIEHSRDDLEYLLKLLDATQEAMTERAVEADYWKTMAIGPDEEKRIKESNLLAAIVTGLGGETFIPDDQLLVMNEQFGVDVLYDAKRAGTTVVVTE